MRKLQIFSLLLLLIITLTDIALSNNQLLNFISTSNHFQTVLFDMLHQNKEDTRLLSSIISGDRCNWYSFVK
jgi:hypothetical protein